MMGPTCGKCGRTMTPADSRIRPELFLHDACLPDELKPAEPSEMTAEQCLTDCQHRLAELMAKVQEVKLLCKRGVHSASTVKALAGNVLKLLEDDDS